MYNVIIWYTYTLWKDSHHWVNNPSSRIFTCFWWENLSSILLENSNYTVVFSTTVTVLYINFSFNLYTEVLFVCSFLLFCLFYFLLQLFLISVHSLLFTKVLLSVLFLVLRYSFFSFLLCFEVFTATNDIGF